MDQESENIDECYNKARWGHVRNGQSELEKEEMGQCQMSGGTKNMKILVREG